MWVICEHIKRDGERCKSRFVRVGERVCIAHGGTSVRRQRGAMLGRRFLKVLRPMLDEHERRDLMLNALPWSAKAELADAMITARMTRDPISLVEMRQRMRVRYAKRFAVLGLDGRV